MSQFRPPRGSTIHPAANHPTASHSTTSHPGMDPGVAAGARRADVPAGDTYSGAGMYDATPSNIGLYAAVAVALLLLAAGAVWVFFG